MTEKDSTLQVELDDNAKYVVKGVGTTSFHLESGDSLHMRDVLYVLGYTISTQIEEPTLHISIGG